MVDVHPGPGVRSTLGGTGDGVFPFNCHAIVNVSLMTHVNTADDPRHVVTLVGLVVKIADPREHERSV